MSKQIIALGGGGFSQEPRNLRLDKYVLEASGIRNPRICFIPTASGDSASYIQRFYRAFKKMDCRPTHLSIFKGSETDIESFLLSQDVLYVGGGNTRNLLLLWREWQIDSAVKKAYEKGIVLAGVSAGALCWFESGLTDSRPKTLTPIKCLKVLRGSFCPHYSNEPGRRTTFKKLINSGKLSCGYAADDSCALHFVDKKPPRAVASRKHCHAYSIKPNTEDMLVPEVL